MVFSTKLFIVIICTLTTIVMARPLTPNTTTSTHATRLGFDDNNKCWETLFELQSCSGEVMMFFLNGETYLGSGCCHALLTIAQQCSTLITTLGLTQHECDIMRGYCEELSHNNNKSNATVNGSNSISDNNNLV
ncbi:putative Prolamin-like domain-containing protein [Lupinus albus]|uniref:Putative Prolamin-like domain-containing protein n=1 Tax=Lupinus albus TaxID=3870 RepID=A0A6A4Q5J4_LUPAL|nr:putative Prolamin-like domain-containing protein [Lupinus albus]